MKKFIQWSVLALAMALFQRAQAAPYTNYMDAVSNVIAFAYSQTGEMPKEHKLLGKALNDFNKPSSSVAEDYKIFTAVATHLLPLQATAPAELVGPLGDASTNAFTNFVANAQAQVGELSERLAAVTPFQKLRRAASNQVAGAVRALTTAGTTTDIRFGILSVGLALKKLVVARKLVEKAEANQGLALDSIEGELLSYETNSDENTLWFVDGEIYQQTTGEEPDSGTYTYTRTGLSTATLVLESQQGQGTTTVKLRFTARNEAGDTQGTLKFKNSEGGSGSSGSGSFSTGSPD